MGVMWYYNWRNLQARRLSTALTLLVVAVMIFVLSLLLSFAAGIQASLAATGRPDNLIILKPGATAESTSIIQQDEAARLAQTPGLAHDTSGQPLLSREACVQTNIPRRTAAGSMANVALRGVEDAAFAVHSEVRLVQGRPFRSGALEVIVGRAAQDRFSGLELDAEINLGRHGQRPYRVVGVFEAGGSALESEIWVPRTMLADSYQRTVYSSVCLRLASREAVPAALAYISSPSVQLEAKMETQYYDDLTSTTRDIVKVTSVLIAIMAIGAVFAVANTMYAAVDGRRREIAMLRAIGFRRPTIIGALVNESLLLCLVACGVGLTVSTLFFSGLRQDYLSDQTWTVLAFEMRMTPPIIMSSLLLAVLVGGLGALAPALRAARLDVLEALRKA